MNRAKAVRAALILLAVGLAAATVYAVVAVTVAFFGWPVKYPDEKLHDRDTKLAIETAIVAGATFVLALIGALVAFAAYLVSVRAPKLDLELTWGSGRINEPEIGLVKDQVTTVKGTDFFGLAADSRLLKIKLKNTTRNSARHPALRLRFVGLYVPEIASIGGEPWQKVLHPKGGDAYEWTGETSIYGTWELRLPDFRLASACFQLSGCAVKWEVVAEDLAKDGEMKIKVRS